MAKKKKSTKKDNDYAKTVLADGTVVVADGFKVCTKCVELLPMAEFGFRRMGNGEIRSQARCRKHR